MLAFATWFRKKAQIRDGHGQNRGVTDQQHFVSLPHARPTRALRTGRSSPEPAPKEFFQMAHEGRPCPKHSACKTWSLPKGPEILENKWGLVVINSTAQARDALEPMPAWRRPNEMHSDSFASGAHGLPQACLETWAVHNGWYTDSESKMQHNVVL